eukprot:102557-Amphidinium_carterae.1
MDRLQLLVAHRVYMMAVRALGDIPPVGSSSFSTPMKPTQIHLRDGVGEAAVCLQALLQNSFQGCQGRREQNRQPRKEVMDHHRILCTGCCQRESFIGIETDWRFPTPCVLLTHVLWSLEFRYLVGYRWHQKSLCGSQGHSEKSLPEYLASTPPKCGMCGRVQ